MLWLWLWLVGTMKVLLGPFHFHRRLASRRRGLPRCRLWLWPWWRWRTFACSKAILRLLMPLVAAGVAGRVSITLRPVELSRIRLSFAVRLCGIMFVISVQCGGRDTDSATRKITQGSTEVPQLELYSLTKCRLSCDAIV